jgi:EAL domain-containing protein (putative c-di-GMP-specific phosphodiesterase class I)
VVFQSLTALRGWEAAGQMVPTVAINFGMDELRSPRLAARLKWELDRFELDPARLTVEVMETVVASAEEDVMMRNLAELREMGCGIDLDDFGTGHASITAIRRFGVQRIKIDRSFVTCVDSDREQQRVVAAILSMAETLGLDTLAEGVETPGEHAMLAQLGCRHVQGFGIARPMPADEVEDWLKTHAARRIEPLRLGKRIG